MQITISDPVTQTIIFSAIFFILVLFSIKKLKSDHFFPLAITQELKGFAILTIIFSHIGYFLSTDTKFLYPLSILAGVGVNLFLFLSGYGLTISQIQKPLSVISFYQKRLIKLFLPLWFVLIILISMDFFILQKSYPLETLLESFLGFYPKADILTSLDSPLWYFTLIFFYYLVFPLFFGKKFLIFSPLLIILFSTFLIDQKFWINENFFLHINKDVLNLYKLHLLSFPLGMFLAMVTQNAKKIDKRLGLILLPFLIFIFVHTAFNSGVGEGKKIEQTISLITMFSIILIFLIKNFQFKLFTLFGVFSYEIYLIHWPLLLRYDYFYKYFPAWLATCLYLGLFIILGCLIQKLTEKILTFKKPS